HMGNITEESFKDIWNSDRYWNVVNHLANKKNIPGMPPFNAQTMCGTLCLQHSVNRYVDNYKKGKIELADPQGSPPPHLSYV
ncbi:MAG: SPASM domain-containing protein, partial [Deltaproteobacteria bacterium]|nr:SPASM domain-containing protein [Deltaproteobacteria bacterium]